MQNSTEDPLAEYRKLAKIKYEKLKAEEDAKKAKLEEEENHRKLEELTKELQTQDELLVIQTFIGEFDSFLVALETTNDVSLILQMIKCQLDSIIDLIKKHDQLKDIQSKVATLVEVLNKIHKDKKHLSYVKELDKIVKEIFKVSGVEIDIELMDTEDDEEYAKKLQEEYYQNTGEDV